MSVITMNRLIKIVLTATVVLTAFCAGAEVTFDARPSSAKLILGEPLRVLLTLELKPSAEQTAVALSERFLLIEVFNSEGQPLPRVPVFEELYHEDSTKSPWLDQTILLTSTAPLWEKTIDLDLQYQFLQPGDYSIKIVWCAPDVGSNDENAIATAIECKFSESPVRLLSGFSSRWEGSITWSCPVKEADIKAYEFLAGGQCPTVYLSSVVTKLQREIRRKLVYSYPTSTYSGYWLEEWYSVPYKRYSDTDTDLMKYLGTGAFLEEHSEITVILDVPKNAGGQVVGRETVDTRTRIQEHRNRLKKFIEENPEFQLRDRLEVSLGYDELALGDTRQAQTHWRWVKQYSATENLILEAQVRLKALEKSGLLATN